MLEKEKPDVVLVHGDTSTTFVTALACFYLQIPVGHVEGGTPPIISILIPRGVQPRSCVYRFSIQLCTDTLSRDNLLREGRSPDNIYVTGNTVIDAMRHTVKGYHHPELDWAGEDKVDLYYSS